MNYLARMIDNGRVIKRLQFEADNPLQAWTIANDGIDPLSGTWVEATRVIDKVPAPHPDKLTAKAEKLGALREYFCIEQGNTPLDLRTALEITGQITHTAGGYVPAPDFSNNDQGADHAQE